jgi:hypothetical protein
MKNLENTQIELAHIKLELENGRTQHFRSFVDQYYCYEHGYVNRNGKAKWDDIFLKEIVSDEATIKGVRALSIKGVRALLAI